MSPGKNKHIPAAERILENIFDFNNECYTLAEEFDWYQNPSKDLEWLILLHKFYYFKELACAYDFTQDERYAVKWVNLTESWIQRVEEDFVNSQVVGRRLQQWILSYRYFIEKWRSPSVSAGFLARFLSSINSQTRYLCNHLTPEGNHRTLELYAIFLVAVTFPELRLASRYLEFSKEKLLENMRRDLLPDGVHRELSTDYHHTVLKNYLRFRQLAQLNEIPLPEDCDNLLRKALEFSCYAHKPDGFIPAINDGDCNSYLPLLKKSLAVFPDSQVQYIVSKGEEGSPTKQRSRVFEHSGYCILRSGWTDRPFDKALYFFFDCAPLGFGSHGHYDALNFELAAYGHSLIVDPGRYTYSEASDDNINWRYYFKGTAAHNTVMVDGLDQTAYQCEQPLEPEPDTRLNFFISTPYCDLFQGQSQSRRYSVLHERTVFFLPPEYWIITDRLLAQDEHQYDLYFHLSERAQDRTVLSNESHFLISSPNLLIAQPACEQTRISIEQGFVSPEYGVKHPAPIVRFSKTAQGDTAFQTVLYPYENEAPAMQVDRLPVSSQGQDCPVTQVTALAIRLNTQGRRYQDYFVFSHLGDEAELCFADIRCACRMLFIRRDTSGIIINLQAVNARFIQADSRTLLTHAEQPLQISYKEGKLKILNNAKDKQLELTVEDSSRWPDLAELWRRHDRSSH